MLCCREQFLNIVLFLTGFPENFLKVFIEADWTLYKIQLIHPCDVREEQKKITSLAHMSNLPTA